MVDNILLIVACCVLVYFAFKFCLAVFSSSISDLTDKDILSDEK